MSPGDSNPPTVSRPLRLRTLVLILLAGHTATALLFVLDRAPGTFAALVGFPLDDSWTHMVYARSLAALSGFAYNPGQPEAGSSSPLWAAALVPASWIARWFGLSIVLPAKLTGMLAAVAASLAACLLVRRLGFGLAAQLAAGLILAAEPTLTFAKLSGMEVALAAAVALWTVAALVHEHHHLAALGAGLAPLARPELLVLSLLVLALLELRLHRKNASARQRLVLVAPIVTALGLWVLYCLLVTGHPLPNTFYGKFASGHHRLITNLEGIFVQLFPSYPWFAYGAGVVLWVAGAALLFHRGWAAGLTVVVFPLTFMLAVAASRNLPQLSSFYWQRYLMPGLPFVLVTVAVGGVGAVTWTWRNRWRAWPLAGLVASALLAVLTVAAWPGAFRRQADLYAWNCQNIEELNVALARWLSDHVPPGETIGVVDAGAARYFGDHRILDVIGLNHHGVMHQKKEALAELDQVRYLSTSPAWYPSFHVSSWRTIHQIATSNYTICRCNQSQILVYHREPDTDPVPSPAGNQETDR
jgi:hypothetical protein